MAGSAISTMDGIDSELAALLGTVGNKGTAAAPPPPDFSSIFGGSGGEGQLDELDADETDTSEQAAEGVELMGSFPEVTRRFADSPHNFFADTNYYKIALSGEGDSATRVHGIMQKYLNCKDPKDRSVFRQQFITAFWDFLGNVAKKSGGKLPSAKRFLLRFGILHPTFLDVETRAFFSKLV
ncbi:MAG: hypothetical protein LBT39_09570, partial [Treponema sp.]|nr:hypothetical protein [Treponema sp.]